MPASVDELMVKIADVCTYKWDMLKNRPLAFFLSAFAGGAFVSFGAMLALSVSAGVPENMAVGFANLLMGLVFTFSLVIIMFSGMTLVTADMAYGIIGIFHKRINCMQFVWGVILAYAGNFTGSIFFMWLLSKGGGYAALPWLVHAHAIGVAKKQVQHPCRFSSWVLSVPGPFKQPHFCSSRPMMTYQRYLWPLTVPLPL